MAGARMITAVVAPILPPEFPALYVVLAASLALCFFLACIEAALKPPPPSGFDKA
jgi:hypothetical protein